MLPIEKGPFTKKYGRPGSLTLSVLKSASAQLNSALFGKAHVYVRLVQHHFQRHYVKTTYIEIKIRSSPDEVELYSSLIKKNWL